MEYASSYFWKEAPFTRLFFPFALGIIAQENLHLHVMVSVVILALTLIGFWSLVTISSFNFYRWRPIAGVFLTVFIFGCGCLQLYVYNHNLSSSPTNLREGNLKKLVLLEPLSEKTNSYKAIACIREIYATDTTFLAKQKILVYFKKDSSCKRLQYGSQIIFAKQLQQIRNSGNPGAFDYQEFCARQGIHEQVFLNPNEFILLDEKETNPINQFLIDTRNVVVGIMKKYIPGEKEAGLAEALLIGYKDDLDKELVTAYSGAGVVHIIAISGLHLGIIYALLNSLFMFGKMKRKSKWIKPVFIIFGLWLFSLIAGASASVLRSALMFSFIVIGECFSRRVSIYNTLSASAFLLLWYDPYWLWDVGFQLSYLAVLSIVVFYKHVYALLYFDSKIADAIWKLNAITISAQILTLPLTIYYFHQFPNYFILANLVAIPLSSLILIGEILLCCLSIVPVAAGWLGWLLSKLILLMNLFIEWTENLPLSKWEQLQINQVQAVLLFISAAVVGYSILLKKKKLILPGLTFLILFLIIRFFSFSSSTNQQKMIIYNVSGHTAIDFIEGRKYFFIGDSSMRLDGFLRNFNLQPARTLYRISEAERLNTLISGENYIQFGSKTILIVDKNFRLQKGNSKIPVDIILVCGNPFIKPKNFLENFQAEQLIIDNSNNWWRINNWEEACRNAGVKCHRTDVNGAFVLNMQ